ncbi:glycoside hydrolase [Erythrobacteraceae bacterium WH01K]|nr:glycoside hydrolase [Erythrobacteraceae bacterium WH01K]
MKRSLPLFVTAAMVAACTTSLPASGESGEGRFYTQQVEAAGIPIRASVATDPAALTAAKAMVGGMLAHRPDLARWLAANDYRVAIIAEEETILDVPENAHWTKPSPDDPRLTRCERKHYSERIGSLTVAAYWNARARGIGGPRTVGSEEDILGLRSSRYFGETIFVHEFAHNVLFAVEGADPALYRQVEAAYANALANGLWKDEYTVTTVQEYWAEGTQFWFDSNRLQAFDGRQILNHRDVADYDPALYAILAAAYGDNHSLASDPFHLSEARIPPGPLPQDTAEVC